MKSSKGESTGTRIGTWTAENPHTQKQQQKQRRRRREGSRAFESRNPTEQGKNNDMKKLWENPTKERTKVFVWGVRGMNVIYMSWRKCFLFYYCIIFEKETKKIGVVDTVCIKEKKVQWSLIIVQIGVLCNEWFPEPGRSPYIYIHSLFLIQVQVSNPTQPTNNLSMCHANFNWIRGTCFLASSFSLFSALILPIPPLLLLLFFFYNLFLFIKIQRVKTYFRAYFFLSLL